MKTSEINAVRKFWLAGVLLLALSISAQAQDNSRRFWPPEFRPATPAATTATPVKPRTGTYKRVSTGRPPMAATANLATIGITVWLWRPPQANDVKETPRILVTKKNGQRAEGVLERVEANTVFSEGQQLRLSVEVPRDGYLYVIDREQYADGTTSEPYLVYPTDPQLGGNRVKAGQVTELPGSDETFEVKRLREDGGAPLVTDTLTFLISPRPLEGLPRANADGSPILLQKAQVEMWEGKWATQLEQLELANGSGRAYTRNEQQASKTKQPLSPADPLPQTVFRVTVKPGDPFLVKLPLKIGK